jgi:23S rRNA maturation mini-RNase III
MDHILHHLDGGSLNYDHLINDSFVLNHLKELESAAAKFAVDCIQDVSVRQKYINGIKNMSDTILSEVKAGNITAQKGAQLANELRNRIMEEARVASTPQGAKYAELKKASGPTLEATYEKYAQKIFKKPFSALTAQEKARINYKTIESSSISNIDTDNISKKLKIAGKVCIVITGAIAVHEILISDNKAKTILQQGSIIGGAIVGGKVFASAFTPFSYICGHGAPICIIAAALIGAMAGGYAANEAFEHFDDQVEEFLRWGIY